MSNLPVNPNQIQEINKELDSLESAEVLANWVQQQQQQQQRQQRQHQQIGLPAEYIASWVQEIEKEFCLPLELIANRGGGGGGGTEFDLPVDVFAERVQEMEREFHETKLRIAQLIREGWFNGSGGGASGERVTGIAANEEKGGGAMKAVFEDEMAMQDRAVEGDWGTSPEKINEMEAAFTRLNEIQTELVNLHELSPKVD
ncbi:hypothetical protein BGZ65_000407 [Modicella reniformis]|uniref:Uncharacterized protein n=1 Tax=Modicella reniformis TaxID=1440133 RepID=A0A9P6LTA9_9FUNG|nr:hypothetical protein BGZ65_000407 [Modicella reniformis]